MDAFEIRLQFVSVLRRLTSSQQSIQRFVTFALRWGPQCGDDLWDCLCEECEKASLNSRINIFYALDGLLEASINESMDESSTTSYPELLKRDLAKIVKLVVPDRREGVLNVMSVTQILNSWKVRRLVEPEIIEPIEVHLANRKSKRSDESSSTSGLGNFKKDDIFRRIEDDRERHKRLRERIWLLPVPLRPDPLQRPATAAILSTNPSPISPASPAQAPTKIKDDNVSTGSDLAIEIEFEQMWDATEPLDESDLMVIKSEFERHRSIG